MSIDIQFRLKSNPYYLNYLHDHSYWYKWLNRTPQSFSKFEEEVKEFYELRTSDKINKALTTFELLSTLFSGD